MKVLIIEDEKNAYDYLSMLLKKIRPDLTLLGQIESVEEAINWFATNPEPDLIFLDIELSDGLSFEIFEHTEVHSPIIFTTAYDQYAIEAFKVHSIGYLLKPVNQRELAQVLDKHEKYRTKDFLDFGNQLKSIFSNVNTSKKQRCLIKKGNHYEFIQLKDIAYAHSDEGLTFLYTFNNERHLYNNTLEGLFKDLDTSQFFQINRSQIINIDAIRKIHPYFNHRLKLELKKLNTNIDFLVSRSKISDFKDWVAG